MKISVQNQDLKSQNSQLQKLQNNLSSQKLQVDNARNTVNDKITTYSNNL